MSKTSTKPEGSDFAAFDASTATEQLRTFAEKTAEQTKENYERMNDET